MSVNDLRHGRRALIDADLDPHAFVTQPLIVRDVLPNGLRILTERMPHVRSVSVGVWLARGSRHEPESQSGIAHFDEHIPLALSVLSDIVMNPAFSPADVEREKKVVLEEIKMVEDTPDDLVHELFTESFWQNHPLGRPILGTPTTVESLSAQGLRAYFTDTYTAPNLIVAAVGNITHEEVRDLVSR